MNKRAARPWPPARGLWLKLSGLGLVLLMVAVVVVQARQMQLLGKTVVGSEDYVVLSIYQVELEYLRLREQWHQAVASPDDMREALQLRYDIWVSRVTLIRTAAMNRLLHGVPDLDPTMEAVGRFIAKADRVLAVPGEQPIDRAQLRSLHDDLQALGAPIHGLTLSAGHRVAEQIAQRDEIVRQHNRLGLTLTVVLTALLLTTGLLALRQMRQLQQRRAVLEELTARLRDAQRDAESASEAKSAFLANMSHEIRTPFQGLLGMLGLLGQTPLTPMQAGHLRTAVESADHLMALLNDVLDMSQLEAGRVTLSPQPVALRSLLDDVESLMTAQAGARQLAFDVKVSPDLPFRLWLDATRVRQVLFNLLSNAIKFTERGAVTLEVEAADGADGQGTIVFRVTDTGIGMDDAMLGRLFSRFGQGDISRSRRYGGTGLGLEISRSLARLMGGDITVRSTPGRGSTFSFWLPLRQAPSETVDEATPVALPMPAERPLAVLVAEDHPVNRHYIAAVLGSMGHDAHFVINGEEAVQAARSRRFDIVLMDLHMPLLDGVGATSAIRALADRHLADVPIVALSADVFPETRARCMAAGMTDFLTKPVDPATLRAALERHARPAGADDASRALAEAAPEAAEAPEVSEASGKAAPPEPAGATAGPASTDPGLLDTAALGQALQLMPRDRLGRLIGQFLDEVPGTVMQLAAALERDDDVLVRERAHELRGAALTLGLPGLAAQASRLHHLGGTLAKADAREVLAAWGEVAAATRRAARAANLLPEPAPEPRRATAG